MAELVAMLAKPLQVCIVASLVLAHVLAKPLQRETFG